MVLTPDGSKCHSKESIEQACLLKNQACFNQASATPLLQPPLYGLVGPLGTGTAALTIFNGEFLYPENPTIQATLNALHHCNPNNSLGPLHITQDDYKNIWHRAKEKTSSCSKYGLHFGQYIAIIQDEELLNFHAMMIDITLMSGYSPTRWCIRLNVMIPKKAGNYMVTGLCTLLLYDAEFNATLKWLGFSIMDQAESLKALAPKQYGSRLDHAVIYQSLNMQLTYDLIRQQRLTAAVCLNDAKACYDRIVHAFAALAILCLGIPIGPISVMFGTIQLLHHFICTAFGDSECSFTGTAMQTPLQGVGQGNGAGPQIWAAVSSPIFDMVRNSGHGSTLQSLLTQDTVKFVGFGFVDDVDLIATDNITHRMASSILSATTNRRFMGNGASNIWQCSLS